MNIIEWKKNLKIKFMRIVIIDQKSKMNHTNSELNDSKLCNMIAQFRPSFVYLCMNQHVVCVVWKRCFAILRSINFVSNHSVSREILRWRFLNLSELRKFSLTPWINLRSIAAWFPIVLSLLVTLVSSLVFLFLSTSITWMSSDVLDFLLHSCCILNASKSVKTPIVMQSTRETDICSSSEMECDHKNRFTRDRQWVSIWVVTFDELCSGTTRWETADSRNASHLC